MLPLSPAVFNILLALSDGQERHGYGIAKEVERRTGGGVRLGPGTLYGGIRRMISQGLIREAGPDSGADDTASEEPEPGGHEQRRRYYRITASGHQVASAEARRLEELVSTARDRGLLPGLSHGPDIVPGET